MYINKQQAIEEFKSIYSEQLQTTFKRDKPAKRQAWNDFQDSLIKSGRVKPNTDWAQPAFIQS